MNDAGNKPGDTTIPNVILCTVLVLMESLQFLIVLVLVFSYFPMTVSDMIHHLFPRHVELVFLKRDMLFFRCWVGAVILGQAVLLTVLRKQLSSPALTRHLRSLCWVEGFWILLMVFSLFKYFVYGYPSWARGLLYMALAGSVMCKLFWNELKIISKSVLAAQSANSALSAKIADILFPLVIAGLIFVPDLHGVVARMWIGDCLHHMDSTLMGQAWAYINGAKLNVDIYAHYGLGMPIFIALLAKGLGIFSYTGVIGILIWAAIVYFILCYFFLRVWLKSISAAIAGILLAIKWQMFHPGDYPFVFTYPYSTVFRYLFDIVFLYMVLAHIRRANFYYLAAAGGICGLALFHVSDTGIYLLIAYVFYLCWLAAEGVANGRRDWKKIVGSSVICLATVFLSAFIFLLIFQGANTWSKDFWEHMAERIQLFLIGHGNLPIYKSLLEGDYTSSLMGFVIPLVYAGIFVATVSLCFMKKIHRSHIMAAVLCVYGLGLYHYYVCRSANTSYYTVCIPFVFVLSWLACQAGRTLGLRYRRSWWGALLGVCAAALLTNHFFLSYPNIFNFSANPIVAPAVKPVIKNMDYYFDNIPRSMPESFKLPVNSLGETDEDLKIETDFKSDAQLKDYFDSEFAFKEDAALIDRLTPPGQSVPLISSFETRLLMQADRKPFFYYFPMIDSRPMRMRMFPFTSLWTTDRLAVMIKQLEQSKPPYVFMERIMLTSQVPRVYENLYPEMFYILSYLESHYQPYQYGQYLVALKRSG
jgi:hypothetical protein